MTKFEIKTDNFQFRMGTRKSSIPSMSADEIMQTYFSCDDRITSNSLDPVLRESFDNEAEAVDFFKVHYSGYGRTRLERYNNQYLLCGEIAWIEENEYDEDGEFDQGGSVIELSAESYKAEKDEDEAVTAILENFASAVELMDDEIREAVHADLAPCTDEEFLVEYMKRHEEKYGEPFTI